MVDMTERNRGKIADLIAGGRFRFDLRKAMVNHWNISSGHWNRSS